MDILSPQIAIKNIYGPEVRIIDQHSVSGGDCNETFRLGLSNGQKLFMKRNTLGNASFFEAESDGLCAMASTGTIAVPQVLSWGIDKEAGFSFLLLPYLDGAEKKKDYWEKFALQLSQMHRADTKAFVSGGKYGFGKDNFIGAGDQINTPKGSWISFFRDCRLIPQFRKAKSWFDTARWKEVLRLLDHLDDYLEEPEYPSLLHGDLWGGNYMTGPDGYAWLIDPAVYVGHREADLAMTELFGGFSASFYRAYREYAGIPGDYDDRRDLYNLYHMLNHLNLFGGGYYHSVAAILARYCK